ncbi:hypothetical protein G2W53_018846 [Senna tora]|uniref:Uncharacterized protein n=1 Tax=Senna tora TaxID=362788 RepID=A0A834TUC2_9FABA|nr:hypothetical protein G2W53_018846 [Senna tora]
MISLKVFPAVVFANLCLTKLSYVTKALIVVAPIICLLNIVHGDEKPSLGYVYDNICTAKKAIKEVFKRKKRFTSLLQISFKLDGISSSKSDLHIAAYHLNPAFYYGKSFREKRVITEALIALLKKRSICSDLTKGLQEMNLYTDHQRNFGKEGARKVTTTIRLAFPLVEEERGGCNGGIC